MSFAFRVDASNEIGLGHLSRCINLADELRKRGNEVMFVSRNNPGSCFELLTERQFKLLILPESVSQADSDLLGVSQAVDAQQTIAALGGCIPNWMIVDHYGINIEWETMLRPHCKGILVIDDLIDRKHDCDLYLNQNYLGDITDELGMVIPVECKTLLGPHYALIKNCFSRLSQRREFEVRHPKRVLVFCGGSDPENLTGLMIDALRSEEYSNLEVDVVVGSNNKFAQETNYNFLPRNFKKHFFTENFSDLLVQADLALGAGGVTTWERMCVGVPAIVASIALNQERTCVELAKVGAITYLGRSSKISTDTIRAALNKALSDAESNREQIEIGQVLVDGLGAKRVAEVLSPSSVDDLKIRKATPDDVLTYYVWAIDSEVRKQSKNQKEIEVSSHRRWFSKKLDSSGSQLFVLEASGLPVGQVRLDRLGNEVQIDYSLDLIVRGRGWSTLMLEMVVSLCTGKGKLVFKAAVRETNPKSIAVFERLEFVRVKPSNLGDGIFTYEFQI